MQTRDLARTAIALATSLLMTTGAEAQPGEPHPLEIHMKHWIAGSGQLRAPNANYDSENPRSFKEFGIHWAWAPDKQHMIGEILAIRADGSSVLSATMYMFYNPVKKTARYLQVGRRGHFTVSEHPARTTPLPYGEAELHETTDYSPDGKTTVTRHANSFSEDGSHQADVYHLKDGEWILQRHWEWTRVPETAAQGN